MKSNKVSKNRILILVVLIMLSIVNFFIMKYLFSINNSILSFIALICNLIFDISLDAIVFIGIVSIVFAIDKGKKR